MNSAIVQFQITDFSWIALINKKNWGGLEAENSFQQ